MKLIVHRNILTLSVMALTVMTAFVSCGEDLDDNRIPAFSVQINLANAGLWNTYGVHGYGDFRYFVRQTGEPSNFFYGETTYTGFGGVLLIDGMNPFEAGSIVPLAYDLACPVECNADIRVAIDPDGLDAVCPVCGSHYDVTMGAGAPLSGPALTGQVKYGLQRYHAWPQNGGYMITR